MASVRVTLQDGETVASKTAQIAATVRSGESRVMQLPEGSWQRRKEQEHLDHHIGMLAALEAGAIC